MGLKSFFNSVQRLLKLATKPGRSELWLSVKICFLGTVVIGVVGFIVKMISSFLSGSWGG